jgi:hypothetical protein
MCILIMRRMRGFRVVLQLHTLVKKSKALGNGMQGGIYFIHVLKTFLELVKVPQGLFDLKDIII